MNGSERVIMDHLFHSDNQHHLLLETFIDTETTKCSIQTALLIHEIFTEHCSKHWKVSSEQTETKVSALMRKDM